MLVNIRALLIPMLICSSFVKNLQIARTKTTVPKLLVHSAHESQVLLSLYRHIRYTNIVKISKCHLFFLAIYLVLNWTLKTIKIKVHIVVLEFDRISYYDACICSWTKSWCSAQLMALLLISCSFGSWKNLVVSFTTRDGIDYKLKETVRRISNRFVLIFYLLC